MNVMAVKARFFYFKRPVFDSSGSNLLLLLIMAIEAKLRHLEIEHKLLWGRMRIVAFCAVLRYGFMNVFGIINSLSLVYVAHKAKGGPLRPQVLLIIRCMRVMADNAAAYGSGAVDEFIRDKFLIMTFKA